MSFSPFPVFERNTNSAPRLRPRPLDRISYTAEFAVLAHSPEPPPPRWVPCPARTSAGSCITPMDCTHFRKRHLAYLDDTLPAELMAEAQRHVLRCDGCAAHDALVRRSLMVAHSMAPSLPSIEPSAEFQSRLRARLAECRAERVAATAGSLGDRVMPPVVHNRFVSPSRTMLAMAASAVIGALAVQALRRETVPTLAMQPVMAMPPAPAARAPYLTPALMQAMATGNPVWPATMVVDEAPAGFVNVQARFAELR